MRKGRDTWTQAHDLALIFIALAYGTDYDLVEEEMQSIIRALQGWREDFGVDEVKEIVMEAMAVYLESDAEEEVAESMHVLKETLAPEDLAHAVDDVIKIAESDGVILSSESSLISVLSDIWEVKQAPGSPIRDVQIGADHPSWTLLHDIGLLYMVIAHGADGDLSEPEIQAMLERIQGWKPSLDEEQARKILREALHIYSSQPDETTLEKSVSAVRDALPRPQRLVVMDDLVYIGERNDGMLNTAARNMIDMLSDVWGVEVRLSEERRS